MPAGVRHSGPFGQARRSTNLRARRAYEPMGFQAEGVARGNAFFGGIYRDELVMALLLPDWKERR